MTVMLKYISLGQSICLSAFVIPVQTGIQTISEDGCRLSLV